MMMTHCEADQVELAFANGSLRVLGQPVRHLDTGATAFFELLLRLKSPSGRIVRPASFLDLAERCGCSSKIDAWVLRKAIELLIESESAGKPLSLSLNLSSQSLGDPRFLRLARREILSCSSVNPARLIIEITETALLADPLKTRRFMLGLMDVGVRFALDDFGVGYSSLSRLRLLPVDYLKLDGSFIGSLTSDPVSREIVKAVSHMATALGKIAIAEHVSSVECAATLRRLGIKYGQGYALGIPRRVSVPSERQPEWKASR